MDHALVMLRGVYFDVCCGEVSERGFALVLWGKGFLLLAVYVCVVMRMEALGLPFFSRCNFALQILY